MKCMKCMKMYEMYEMYEILKIIKGCNINYSSLWIYKTLKNNNRS